MTTYYRIHKDLRQERGPAAEYPCEKCGTTEGRREWAYQYNAGDDELTETRPGRFFGCKYALDVWKNYSPMCVPCHRKLDREKDPRIMETFRRNGKRNGLAQRGKPKAPGHIEKVWATRKKRMSEDPGFGREYRDRYSKRMSRTNTRRFRCIECGYENNAGNLGWHSKKTGHDGREQVETS